MFQSLDEQLARETPTLKERLVRYALVALVSTGVLGGLILVILMFE